MDAMRTTVSLRKVGLVICSTAVAALTGCVRYAERRAEPASSYQPQPNEGGAYVAPEESSYATVRSEEDFYEPLSPYGQWVVVASYGRCWVPARVETGWRPYCNG